MKPVLIVGLGNPLAGDDGVGWYLAQRLREHDRLPEDVEILQACDPLTLERELEDRALVLLIDALLDDDAPCGRLIPIDDFSVVENRTGSVRHLPAARALALLRGLYPEIRDVPITRLGVSVQRARLDHALSPPLAARLDELAEGVLDLITEKAGRPTER
jgi:hydrogenase maturation protease